MPITAVAMVLLLLQRNGPFRVVLVQHGNAPTTAPPAPAPSLVTAVNSIYPFGAPAYCRRGIAVLGVWRSRRSANRVRRCR